MPTLNYQIAALDNDPSPGDTDATKEYDFQDLQGEPRRATEQIQAIERLGVDYHGIRKTGIRAAPFTLRSIEYITFDTDLATTIGNAWDQLALYEALKGHALGVKVTQRSREHYPCDVLEVVEQQSPYAIGAAAGSLVANPAVQLNCIWTLRMRQA